MQEIVDFLIEWLPDFDSKWSEFHSETWNNKPLKFDYENWFVYDLFVEKYFNDALNNAIISTK